MTKALVLAGGGTRGSYENGAIHALRELGEDNWDMVLGTSIGALNAVMVVQEDYDKMDELWHHLHQDEIINGGVSVEMDFNTIIGERNQIAPFLKNFIKEKGADITPLIHRIEELYDPERFMNSKTDFACVVAKNKTKQPVLVTKDMMKFYGVDWLISTASAYPAFPVHRFQGEEYIDGGYYDNLPIDYAMQLGADEIIAIDMNSEPQHPGLMNREGITYIFPRQETGFFLVFDPVLLRSMECYGYNDTMKKYGKLDGEKFTFRKNELPSWFDQYYRHFLILENQVKQASDINRRFNSDQPITDQLLQHTHRKTLSKKQTYYALMDCVMDVLKCEVEKVWDKEEVVNLLKQEFDDCRKEDYVFAPSLNPIQLITYTTSLDQKGILAKMIHSCYFEEHVYFPQNVILTIYPLQYALAHFIYGLLNEEVKEQW